VYPDNQRVAKLLLNLHDIYNRGDPIDRALQEVIQDAIGKKIRLVETSPARDPARCKKGAAI
jgi:hypothetical protein